MARADTDRGAGGEFRRIGGLHAVETAIGGGGARVRRLLVDPRRRDKRMRRALEHARRAGIEPEPVAAAELTDWLGDDRHQGIAAEIIGPAMLDESALVDLVAGLAHPALVLALDRVQDPHNLGACLRSAEAAGADAVVVPRDRSARLTPAVERAAAGAAGRMPLAAVTNLARTLERLQAGGCWVFGTAADGAQSLYDTDLTGSAVLVLGGEGEGMRTRTRTTCDVTVAIPLAAASESLNVSVAAALCLFEARRQRRA